MFILPGIDTVATVNLEITTGAWIEMVCPVSEGSPPPPDISWTISNDLVVGSEQMNATIMTHANGSLTIGSVTEAHSGNYTCTVNNAVASEMLVYHLDIILPGKSYLQSFKTEVSRGKMIPNNLLFVRSFV